MTDLPSPVQQLPSILLAEESEISAAIIARHLQGKFDIVHARDGFEAWHLLETTPAIEVMILDMQLTRLPARELLAKIRSSTAPRLKDIPGLARPPAPDGPAREVPFVGGASDFIGRPVDALELLARVGVHQKLALTIRELETSRQLLLEQTKDDSLTRLQKRPGS